MYFNSGFVTLKVMFFKVEFFNWVWLLHIYLIVNHLVWDYVLLKVDDDGR